jgi:hypothetical protein
MNTRPVLTLRRRDFLLCGAAMTSVPSFAATQPFWDRKPPSEWTESEIDSLVTSSPWAHRFSASLTRSYDDRSPTIPQSPRTTGGGWGIPGGGRVGGLGLPGGRTSGPSRRTVRTPIEGVVRFDSALPIVEALRAPVPEDFEKMLVLSVSGIPSWGPAADGSLSADALKQSAQLEVDSKVAPPELVRECVTAAGTTRTFLLGFSRERAPLSGASRNVAFTARISEAKIRAQFKPNEMTYRGTFNA